MQLGLSICRGGFALRPLVLLLLAASPVHRASVSLRKPPSSSASLSPFTPSSSLSPLLAQQHHTCLHTLITLDAGARLQTSSIPHVTAIPPHLTAGQHLCVVTSPVPLPLLRSWPAVPLASFPIRGYDCSAPRLSWSTHSNSLAVPGRPW